MKFPLWLPEGSVRAVLALSVVLSLIVSVFLLIYLDHSESKTAIGALILLAGIIIRDYFEQRKEEHRFDVNKD